MGIKSKVSFKAIKCNNWIIMLRKVSYKTHEMTSTSIILCSLFSLL